MGGVIEVDCLAREKVANAFRGKRKAAMARAKRVVQEPLDSHAQTTEPAVKTEGSREPGKKVAKGVC